MIHRRKGRKFNRTHSHRKALFANLCASLIKNKKIKTTLAKAKELRMYVEPLINKSKIAYNAGQADLNVHARREAQRILNDREAVSALFNDIAPKVANRNGGYTRVLKMGRRLGDGAEVALIELVDYNIEQAKPVEPAEDTKKTKKTAVKGKTKKTAKETAETKKPAKKKAETKKSETKKTETKKTTKTTKKKEAAK